MFSFAKNYCLPSPNDFVEPVATCLPEGIQMSAHHLGLAKSIVAPLNSRMRCDDDWRQCEIPTPTFFLAAPGALGVLSDWVLVEQPMLLMGSRSSFPVIDASRRRIVAPNTEVRIE